MAKGKRFPSYDEADLLLREAPILTIKELMGHTRIEMTMRYARLKEEVELLTSRSTLTPAPTRWVSFWWVC